MSIGRTIPVGTHMPPPTEQKARSPMTLRGLRDGDAGRGGQYCSERSWKSKQFLQSTQVQVLFRIGEDVISWTLKILGSLPFG